MSCTVHLRRLITPERAGDYIFKKYQVKEIDRKLSRRLDISLLLEFDSVRLWFLESKKGGKK